MYNSNDTVPLIGSHLPMITLPVFTAKGRGAQGGERNGGTQRGVVMFRVDPDVGTQASWP